MGLNLGKNRTNEGFTDEKGWDRNIYIELHIYVQTLIFVEG